MQGDLTLNPMRLGSGRGGGLARPEPLLVEEDVATQRVLVHHPFHRPGGVRPPTPSTPNCFGGMVGVGTPQVGARPVAAATAVAGHFTTPEDL